MGTRTQSGRIRCAIAAGTLAAAVAGGSVFAAGAAYAGTNTNTGVGTGGATVAGPVTDGGGTAPLVGTGATTGSVLTQPPVTATVPVTVTTGNLLSSSSGPRTTTSTTNSNSNNPSSTTTNSPTTTTTGPTTTGSTSTSTTSGSGNSSTGATTTTGSTSTSTTDNSASNSNSSSSNSSNSSNSSSADTTTSTTTSNALEQVRLARSSSAVYPAKDGFDDDITFDVRPLDAQGRPVAVTGKAYLVVGGRIVKTWEIDGSTSKIVWDGLVDGKIVPGTYSFVLDVRSATGVSAQSTSSFSVSGKKLVKRTVTVKRAATALKKGVALPSVVSKNLKYGPVTVRATVAKKLKKSVQVNIVRTGADRKVVIKKGKRTSGTATLPAASKAVKVVLAKKSRGVKTGKVTVTYRYTKLG